MQISELKLAVTSVFMRSWATKGRIVVHRGSTRSSKTYSMCQQIAVWLMTGQIRDNLHIPKGRATIVRKHATTIRKTVEPDFIGILIDMGVYGMVNHNKTNKEITYAGRQVHFIGADDEQKIRGFESDILYCNEANELVYDKEFFQLFIRTKHLTFIDLNPSDPYVWINERIEQERAVNEGDVDVIVSTFKDNPNIPPLQRKEIERLEQVDPQLWQVYGLGQYGKIEGLIYPSFTIVDEMPPHLAKRGYGLDFGFSNDPASLVDCGVLNKQDLYLDEIVYSTELTNSDLSELMKREQVRKDRPIYGDAAEPKSIEDLKRLGWPVKAASKGPDSVRFGIDIVRRHNLFVTARSINLIRELRRYKWATDNAGRQLARPASTDDHALDAVRYYGIMALARPAITML